MPGFNLAIGAHRFPKCNYDDCELLYDSILESDISIQKFTINKFENDKLFVNEKDVILILEGVILNKKELVKPGSNWRETVKLLYRENGDSFFSEFRGSFSGALYDKKLNKWIIFTDHIGSKHIYYYRQEKEVYISCEIVDLYELFKNAKISYSLDIQGAYMLLSYGYMLEEFTLCSQIKKLRPGSYLKIENGSLSLFEYYRLPEISDQDVSENEAVENIDKLFRQAIYLQFEKDKEYGYNHCVSLSGGLDSRMTSIVAHDLGYKNQLNYTFSQTRYLDETIAKKIASDLNHEWIFKSLDNGMFLFDIDQINLISGGNVLYSSLAHSNSLFKFLNFLNLGILHSGQLGDVIIGSFGRGEPYSKSKPYSKTLLSKVSEINTNLYATFELKNMYQRGFNCANSGLLPSQKHSETMSPFYDVDLMNYCLRLPINYRINHRLYRKWILKKYPKAASYVWEATKDKLTSPVFKALGKEFTTKQIKNKVFNRLKILKSAGETPFHMNPFGYWYNTNSELRRFQDSYFENNIDNIKGNPELKIDCNDLYLGGNAIEKIQVLTLLSALKMFFS